MTALSWVLLGIVVAMWLVPTFANLTKNHESCKPEDEEEDK